MGYVRPKCHASVEKLFALKKCTDNTRIFSNDFLDDLFSNSNGTELPAYRVFRKMLMHLHPDQNTCKNLNPFYVVYNEYIKYRDNYTQKTFSVFCKKGFAKYYTTDVDGFDEYTADVSVTGNKNNTFEGDGLYSAY